MLRASTNWILIARRSREFLTRPSATSEYWLHFRPRLTSDLYFRPNYNAKTVSVSDRRGAIFLILTAKLLVKSQFCNLTHTLAAPARVRIIFALAKPKWAPLLE